MKGRRIIIAESDERVRKQLKELLTREGYLVIGEATDGVTALQLTRSIHPDIVILELALPGMNGVEVAKIIEENRIAPVVLLCEYRHKEIVNRLSQTWLFGYVFKPFQDLNLSLALDMAISQFTKFAKLEEEINTLKKDLESRKIIERAKGLLIKHKNLSEEEAFKFIQKQSMNKRLSKKAIAEAIILAYEI